MERYQLRSQITRDYFRRRGTVASWWEPEGYGTHVKFKQQQIYKQERKMVLHWVNSYDKVILDVGTGKGRFAIDFAAHGAAKVIGIDINAEMITIAIERCQMAGVRNVDFQVGDAKELPYKANTFDVVVCIQTFMHLPDPYNALLELKRVVRPGGRVVVDHENIMPYWRITHGSIKSLGHLLLRRMLWSRSQIMTGIRKSDFLEMFKIVGLRVPQVYDFGPKWCPAYFLVCASK